MSSRMRVLDVRKRLERHLERSNLRPQDRLQPERDLAAVIGCSRETVRRALDLMERDGLVWRHQGKGTFLGALPTTTVRPLQRVIEATSPSELMNARLVLEPAIAAAAAVAATPRDIEELREVATATGHATDWRHYETLDDEFHKAVARATGNPLLIAIFAALASVRGRARWQRQHDEMFRRASKQVYAARQSEMQLHIAEAIERGDPEDAERTMSDHLRTIRDLIY